MLGGSFLGDNDGGECTISELLIVVHAVRAAEKLRIHGCPFKLDYTGPGLTHAYTPMHHVRVSIAFVARATIHTPFFFTSTSSAP